VENSENHNETIKSNRELLPISWLSTTNLQLLIEIMKQSLLWTRGKPCSNILLNHQKKKIVLAVLPKNTEVVSFQDCDSITFRVIEGRLKLESKNRTAFLDKGHDLTLFDKEEYFLSNSEETAYLLTMVN
jgi:hypothetical protein